jgi:hypothetical protein
VPLLFDGDPITIGSFIALVIRDFEAPLAPERGTAESSDSEGNEAEIEKVAALYLEFAITNLDADILCPRKT